MIGLRFEQSLTLIFFEAQNVQPNHLETKDSHVDIILVCFCSVISEFVAYQLYIEKNFILREVNDLFKTGKIESKPYQTSQRTQK